MTAFSDMLAADAVAIFCDADGGLAEPVVYTAKGAGPRTINAVVFRDPPAPVLGAGGEPGTSKTAPYLRLFIPNDDDDGVTAVIVGGDTITVANRQGEAPTAQPVVSIVSQDAGGWMLRLR